MNAAKIVFTATNHTCNEACWNAIEEECHCSCGGRNHGILRHGGPKPKRTKRIKGQWYELAAIGQWTEIRTQGYKLNEQARLNGESNWFTYAVDEAASPTQMKWLELQPYNEYRPSILWVRTRTQPTQAKAL